MDNNINHLGFRGYAPNGFKPKADDKSNEQVDLSQKAVEKESTAKPQDVLNALDAQGAYNKAQININKTAPVHFDAQRVSEIEAMMLEFENGVNKTAQAIETEFPNRLSTSAKNALAARIFAQE